MDIDRSAVKSDNGNSTKILPPGINDRVILDGSMLFDPITGQVSRLFNTVKISLITGPYLHFAGVRHIEMVTATDQFRTLDAVSTTSGTTPVHLAY